MGAVSALGADAGHAAAAHDASHGASAHGAAHAHGHVSAFSLKQIAHSYLTAYMFCLSLCVGSLFLTLAHQRGIKIVPGTDTGGAFTLHRELELYQRIGMTPAEILARATLEMAQHTGRDQTLGSIEKGKVAGLYDLVGKFDRQGLLSSIGDALGGYSATQWGAAA